MYVLNLLKSIVHKSLGVLIFFTQYYESRVCLSCRMCIAPMASYAPLYTTIHFSLKLPQVSSTTANTEIKILICVHLGNSMPEPPVPLLPVGELSHKSWAPSFQYRWTVLRVVIKVYILSTMCEGSHFPTFLPTLGGNGLFIYGK